MLHFGQIITVPTIPLGIGIIIHRITMHGILFQYSVIEIISILA